MTKERTFALTLFVIYLLAVAWCCFGHFNDLPDIGQDSIFGIPVDKVIHFMMFFPFTPLCYYAFRKRKNGKHPVFAVAAVLAVGCIVAGATEIGQSFTGYRSCDPADFLADALSLAVAGVLTLACELHLAKSKRNGDNQ